MKNKEQIIIQQKEFIKKMENAAVNFIDSIDKSQIETILLSGSVARGDYFPQKNENGEDEGMIDLIVMKKDGSSITAEELFGKNQDPEIPYHCIKVEGIWFQILFTDFITCQKFASFDDPRKFSVLESKILYDSNNRYKKELEEINKNKAEECKRKFEEKKGYIYYLISDYKTRRWFRRDAFLQLHENLNTAIRESIYCLYYLNNSYAPAEDRMVYYSLSLEKLPKNYENFILELKNQTTDSLENYKLREELFKTNVLSFLEKN